VVVVGGGLTGLELAAEVAESFPHADVTLVTAGRPGGWLSARAQAYVADALDALGVRRITDTGSPASPQARSTTAARSTCACGRWVHCAAAIPGPWGDALAMGCRTGGFTGPWAADVVVARLRGLPARPFRFRYFHECPAAAPQRGAVGA
jgi:hypothetical protein